MNERDHDRRKRAIEETARDLRTAVQKNGGDISHEQARERVTRATLREERGSGK